MKPRYTPEEIRTRQQTVGPDEWLLLDAMYTAMDNYLALSATRRDWIRELRTKLGHELDGVSDPKMQALIPEAPYYSEMGLKIDEGYFVLETLRSDYLAMEEQYYKEHDHEGRNADQS